MYEEEGQQQGDGLDDEIGRSAPSLEFIRDWPMYSPQRSPTEWCADQVLEFSVQWEWASAPMYSPQRSPTLWCFDREQFPDQPHQRESRSYRWCSFSGIGIHITISSDEVLKLLIKIQKELLKQFRKDAATSLGVSVPTFKRICRENGISRWPMPSRERKLNGCSVVEQRLLNNSDHQNSPGSEPLEVVRPLQQRNEGVVIREDNDEQSVNFIPINERSPTLWCFDREQFPDRPHQRESTSYRQCEGIRITRSICLDDLRKHFGLRRGEAAKRLGVSVPTLKRHCRRLGIVIWPNGCSVIEQKLLNNSDHQNSPGSEPLEVVRPLQQRNDGVVIRDDNDEQNVSLIPINEVRPLQQRNDGVVIRDDNDEQNVSLIPINEGYSLEEGRHVEVNSLMDEKLYSGVQDIQLFQPSRPEVEIMQEDSSEQQILGELGPKNIGHKAVQKKEKGRSKKNVGHKVASAGKSCKKKNTTETPTTKYWTKRFISKEDILQHVGQKRADAVKALGFSVSTFRRYRRKNGITTRWNGDGCPRVEPELLNNSVHQSSPGSIPAEIRGEKETSALLRAKQDDVTIKAKFGGSILKFQLSSKSGVRELNKEVAKRSSLELDSFKVEYLDEDEEPILIACNEDFQACVEFFSRSSSNQVIRLLVKNKVSNSEKSHQSCSGLKRKEASTSSSRAACTLRGRKRGREGVAEMEREKVDYIQYLPEPFQPYMSHTKNVKADGHCGFRAIAAQIYDTEEDWAKVRHDLIQEIRQNKDLYDVLYREHNWADKLLESLNYFQPTALEPNWMDCMSLGVVIASRYNIVLYTFDAIVGCCYTHLPLRSPPVPVKQRKEIAIARINNHFMQLFLHPHHPVPPVPMLWWEHASDEAKGWALSYNLTLWFHVLGVVPGSQFGGNID